MTTEATISHWVISVLGVGKKTGWCMGTVKKVLGEKTAIVLVEPSVEKCNECVLKKFCDGSAVEPD